MLNRSRKWTRRQFALTSDSDRLQDDQATLTEAEDSDKLKSEAAVLADEVKSLKAQLKNLTAGASLLAPSVHWSWPWPVADIRRFIHFPDRDKMASVPGTSELITLSTHLRDEVQELCH